MFLIHLKLLKRIFIKTIIHSVRDTFQNETSRIILYFLNSKSSLSLNKISYHAVDISYEHTLCFLLPKLLNTNNPIPLDLTTPHFPPHIVNKQPYKDISKQVPPKLYQRTDMFGERERTDRGTIGKRRISSRRRLDVVCYPVGPIERQSFRGPVDCQKYSDVGTRWDRIMEAV